MKKVTKTLIVLALTLFCAPAAAATKAQVNTVDYSASGDSIKEGVQKLDDELDLIYGHLNALETLNAGSTAPSSPGLGTLWVDTTVPAAPTLNYWDGSAWVNIVALNITYDSGLTLDAGARNLSDGMYLYRTADGTATVYGSAAAPATVTVGDGIVLQNATDTTVSIPLVGIAEPGVSYYKIIARRSGTTSNFTLAGEVQSYTLLDDERLVGTVTVPPDQLRSVESDTEQAAQVPFSIFHIWRTAGQSIGTSYTKVTFDHEEIDIDDICSGATCTITRAGFYEINGSVTVTPSAAANGYAAIYVNGVLIAEAADRIDAGSKPLNPRVSAYIYLAVGDYVELYGKSGTADNSTQNGYFSTAMWGRWIGRKW